MKIKYLKTGEWIIAIGNRIFHNGSFHIRNKKDLKLVKFLLKNKLIKVSQPKHLRKEY